MKILTCPVNGPRNIGEFVYGGELHAQPDPAALGDEEWAQHLFGTGNRQAVTTEWWCHAPTNTWFIAERDRRTDEVLSTYLPGAAPK